MAITLALLTAALFGTGDFLGGLAGKRMSVLRVLAISHTIGLVLITVGAIVIADEFLLGDLAWGALAGIAGFIGLALLYRGLARARWAWSHPSRRSRQPQYPPGGAAHR